MSEGCFLRYLEWAPHTSCKSTARELIARDPPESEMFENGSKEWGDKKASSSHVVGDILVVTYGIVFGPSVVSVKCMRGVVPCDKLFGKGLVGSLVTVEMQQRGCVGCICLAASPCSHRCVEGVRRVVPHMGGLHHGSVEVQRYTRIAQHIQRGKYTWDVEVSVVASWDGRNDGYR